MKTNRQEYALRVSVAAVRSAALALALMQGAHAQDAGGEGNASELTTPKKTVEVGAGWVSRDSAKFGEYNGLENKGVYGIGNLDLRGGGSFDSNDPSRWRLSGHNLGLDTRDGKLEYGWQGLFRINLGYDELLRNRSDNNDTYSSPYLGVGGTHLVLPGNWHSPAYMTAATMQSATGLFNAYPFFQGSMLGLAATSYNSPLVANSVYVCNSSKGAPAAANGCAINPALAGTLGKIATTGFPQNPTNAQILANNLTDLGDFHPVDLSTKRQKLDFGASYDIDPRMQVAFSMRHEKKNGLKQMGVVNSGTAPASVGTGAAAGQGYSAAAENSVIFPELIDTTTDQYNASFNFTDKKWFATFAYYGSVFTNNVKSMTIDNPLALGSKPIFNAYGISSATISEEPDNTLHQFRLTGGYNLTSRTKAVVDASYSRNTQNDPFVLDPAMFATPTDPGLAPAAGALNNASYAPVNSANAVVVNKTFDLKLTSRPMNRLSVSAAYKYDNRDNQTPVNNYVWYDAGAKNFGAIQGPLAASTNASPLQTANVPGIPSTLPLYSGVNVVANRPYSKTLNQVDLDTDFTVAPGHVLKLGVDWQSINRYCNGTWIDCSFADQSKEATLKTEYRFIAGESISGRIGFDQGSRTVDYNNNAWMALVPSMTATNIAGLTAQGYNGSIQGFLNAFGLTANGLPLAANVPANLPAKLGLTATQVANIYNLLFGAGNGSLSNSYYANHNVTENWAGLDVYNMANRDRSRLRGSIEWQANEKLALQTGLDYRRDDYPENVFGLQNTNAWALSFDGELTPNEDLSMGAYFNHEDQRTRTSGDSATNSTVSTPGTGTNYFVYPATVAGGANRGVTGLCPNASTAGLTAGAGGYNPYQVYQNNLKIDPCAVWTANMRDRTDTLGFSFTKKRLVSRKFTLSGDVSYSRSLTTNQMTGGYYAANTLAPYAANVPAAYFVNAAALPAVTSSVARLGLSGRYQATKTSMVRVSYSVSRLHVDDYMYGTLQPATTSGSVMPTLEQAPNYIVHVIGVSYAYSFQ